MGTIIPNQFTVAFLCNALPPGEVVCLRRGDTRTFAPNMYTGVGGKLEQEDGPDGQLRAALRELKEETGITGVTLIEFGRLIVNGTKTLYYFVGLYDRILPLPESDEGTLEWVALDTIFGKDVIPTTRVFLKEWQKRGWDTSRPFTVRLERADLDALDSEILSVEVEEGLNR